MFSLYDVLLTSGDAKPSRVNKKAQVIIRRMDAPYSHSSMFVSPFLLVAVAKDNLFPDRRAIVLVLEREHAATVTTRRDGGGAAEVRQTGPQEP
jgi:hypothetical protein